MGFGVRFQGATRGQLAARATPPSGASPEAIWHQWYDTQSYLTGATTTLTFFQTTNADPTLSNMQAAGQFPDPMWFTLYDLTCDFLSQNTAQAANVLGELNDQSLLLKVGRATWTLTISDKNYGPYSLTVLHGTGGPVGMGWGAVATGGQYSNNCLTPGWSYQGSLIIPPKTSFKIVLNWAAAQGTTLATLPIRLSLFGILSRRTL